ncbi:MAG: fibronectin type III domain-containing protein [Thermoplasmatota archaeon]
MTGDLSDFNFVKIPIVILGLMLSSITLPFLLSQPVQPLMLNNLELVTVDQTSAEVTWTTNLRSDTRIQWGETEELDNEIVIDESTNYHLGRMPNLEPGTSFHFRIGSGSTWSEVYSFSTLTSPGIEPILTFAMFSDTHISVDGYNTVTGFMAGDSERLLGSMVEELNSIDGLEFAILLGDNTNGLPADYESFSSIMATMNIPWYPVMGNWDKTVDEWATLASLHYGLEETYYSFDQGGFHFVFLDSAVQDEIGGSIGADQLSWLESDLDVNKGKMTMVFLHHPVQMEGDVGLDELSRSRLMEIFDRRAWVVSVTGGHNHLNELETGSFGIYNSIASVVQYPIGYSVVSVYEGSFTQSFRKIPSELETSEESRLRMEASSGNQDADMEYLGELHERSMRVDLNDHYPVVERITATPERLYPGETSLIEVSAFDPDGSDISVDFEADAGKISDEGRSAVWKAPDEIGRYTISVIVSDGSLEVEDTVNLFVLDPSEPINHAPVISEMNISREEVDPGETVAVTVTAVDEDGDEILYGYTVSGGAISGSGNSVEWTLPEAAGDYIITVQVHDQFEASNEMKGEVTVKAVLPNSDDDEPSDDDDDQIPHISDEDDLFSLAEVLVMIIFVTFVFTVSLLLMLRRRKRF